MKQNSSLRICDFTEMINNLYPIKIFINSELIWDDDFYDISEYHDSIIVYNEILNRKDIVLSITFDVVMFHHTIVYIETE